MYNWKRTFLFSLDKFFAPYGNISTYFLTIDGQIRNHAKKKKKKKIELISKQKRTVYFQFKYFIDLYYLKKRTLFFFLQSCKYRTGDRYGRQVSPK